MRTLLLPRHKCCYGGVLVHFTGNYPLDNPGIALFLELLPLMNFGLMVRRTKQYSASNPRDNRNDDVSDDGVQTVTVRGHILSPLPLSDASAYKFSGLNPNNITAPGLYYMQVGLHLTWCAEKVLPRVWSYTCNCVA